MTTKKVNQQRRAFLKASGIGAAGLLTGTVAQAENPKATNTYSDKDKQYSFYGEHQAGITTPQQSHVYFLVLDLHSNDKETIKETFQIWTQYAARLTKGEQVKPYSSNHLIPPADTGEADDLLAYGLTLTFGISPSFLEKLGLSNKAPSVFKELPLFPRDQLRQEWSGGDICIQACADNAQVAFHAIRQLVRVARSNVTMRWSQSGFITADSPKDTPRNLFGFKDGTANRNTQSEDIWVEQPDWLKGGSYLVVRKIAMHLETWDRTSYKEQERTFGRDRVSGAPFGEQDEFAPFDYTKMDSKGKSLIPEDSHSALANKTGQRILRRAYSYSDGINPKTGQFESGLLFICFQRSPEQFIAIQKALGNVDRMNEYITHIGSGLFACFGGVKEGEYLGQALFE